MLNRQEDIKAELRGLGTELDGRYTNQEIIDYLSDFQNAIANVVFERTHAECLSNKDVMMHIKVLAEEYGLQDSELFKRLRKNMNHLHHTIYTFIRGIRGEERCRNGLKLLSYDKDVRILYNLSLDDGVMNTEYDAIVVTPYGLFVVEVKNWSNEIVIDSNGFLKKSNQVSYDLAGRLGIKEALIKEYLEGVAEIPVHSILMIPDPKSLDDHYQKIDVCLGLGITAKIREYEHCGTNLTSNDIDQIVATLQNHQVVQKTNCDVDCEAITEDFAEFITLIEEKAVKESEALGTTDIDDIPDEGFKMPTWFKETLKAGFFTLVGFGISHVFNKKTPIKRY